MSLLRRRRSKASFKFCLRGRQIVLSWETSTSGHKVTAQMDAHQIFWEVIVSSTHAASHIYKQQASALHHQATSAHDKKMLPVHTMNLTKNHLGGLSTL